MIRKRVPDKFKARSLVTAAEKEIKFTLSRAVVNHSVPSRLLNNETNKISKISRPVIFTLKSCLKINGVRIKAPIKCS